MTHIPLKTALTAALAAAEEGAAVVRHYATEARSRLVLHDKGTFELVSEADVEVQRVLVRHLDGVIPGARFLGEEEGLGEAEDRSGWWWILDPIDGTTNFLHGVPPYAISIGLVGDGVPVLGVVHDVPHHEVFAGYEGGGVTCNGVPVTCSVTPDLGHALIATGFPYKTFDYADAYWAAMQGFFGKTRGIRRHGAASVDLAWVAAGRFEAFFERGLSPWDVAGGLALLREAGGTYSDFAGHPVDVFSADLLASNSLLHPALLPILAPLAASK